MAYYPLSTVVSVSLTGPTPGFAGFNTGNLAIFSDEATANSFPSAGIQYYQSSTQVGIDFGTSSRTYQMANTVFSANPNILLASGQLIIVAMKTASQALVLSGTPASGATCLTWGGNASVSVAWNAINSVIQTAIQGIPGLSEATCTGTLEANDLVVSMIGVYGTAPSLFTLTTNTLETGGSSAITLTSATNTGGESIATCLNRTVNSTSYAGVIPNHTYDDIGTTDFNAAATAFQALNVFWGVVGLTDAENASPSGVFYENMLAGNNQTRTLTYLNTTAPNSPGLTYLSGYMSRLMSVNYSGSRTKLTMNGKQLNGVTVDAVIAPGTQFNDAKAAGSDIYVSIAGTPFVISSGANLYADQVTGRLWLKGAIQTAYFNLLAQTSTEINQDQDGLNTIVAALKKVMNQGVTCGYIVGGGTWDLPDTFGNITNFYANISNYGFYIYMPPANQQSLTNLENRIAPLAQIAYIEQAPVHTASVLLNVMP